MKFERSAGFILYRDVAPGDVAPADVVPGASKRVFLLLDYGSHWDYPKGHVEAGEDDLTAARRELMEETGISEAEVAEGFAQEISYIFRARKGGLIQKSVVFFLARTTVEQVTLSHEHVGSDWLDAEAALQRLSYANARSVLEAAIAHLNTGHSA